MKPQQQKPKWALKLSAIAEKVDADKMSAWVAAGEVRSAYVSFLEATYVYPEKWRKEEIKAWYNATPRLGRPAAELIHWAGTLKAKGGKRNAFFDSPELQAAIEAIRRAYNRELTRKYGPAIWYWEP